VEEVEEEEKEDETHHIECETQFFFADGRKRRNVTERI
jgi:hypothetical protein